MIGAVPAEPMNRYEPILRKTMPELDSIRGLAILGVLFTHGFYYSSSAALYKSVFAKLAISATMPGRMGVNLFFVLSGFLITGLLIDSRNNPNYFGRFYLRRALRILPVYYLILAILFFSNFSNWSFVALSVLYLSNLTPLWGVPIAYQVLWSLAVEEHFYLFWPAFTKKLNLFALASCSVAIIVLSPLVRLASFYLSNHNGIQHYDFDLYTWNAADGLACGALVSILLRVTSIERRRVWKGTLVSFALAAVIFAIGIPLGVLTRERPVGAALQPTPWNFAFVGLLLTFLLAGTSGWKWLVNRPTLKFFGYISYGLYLWHMLVFNAYDVATNKYFPPLAQLLREDRLSRISVHPSFFLLCLRFLIAGGFSVAIAYASRRWLEEPFLRMKDRLSKAAVV